MANNRSFLLRTGAKNEKQTIIYYIEQKLGNVTLRSKVVQLNAKQGNQLISCLFLDIYEARITRFTRKEEMVSAVFIVIC